MGLKINFQERFVFVPSNPYAVSVDKNPAYQITIEKVEKNKCL